MDKDVFGVILIILSSVCVNLLDAAATCPAGGVRFQDSCYIIGHAQNMTFVAAEEFCRQHGGHEIHIDNQMENIFIKQTLTQLKALTIWNGLTDESIEGIWQWYDTMKDATFTDWLPGEPNDRNGEDCSVLVPPLYQTNDYRCNAMFQPLCEIRSAESIGIVG